MYDLLIKGGRVIDPSQDLDGKLDIGISGGKIASIAKDIPPHESYKTVDVTGKIVTPGLIDLHCHVSGGIENMGIDPDTAGVKQGVTVVGDGGSVGQGFFGGFPKYVIPSSMTTVFCFLNLASQGMILRPELRSWYEINEEAMARKIEANRQIIKGIKVRLVGELFNDSAEKVWDVAKRVAKPFGLPIMIHIGDGGKRVSGTLARQILPMMEAGDIASHIFTSEYAGCLLADGSFCPELREAQKRGVILDIACGGRHLSFEVARRGISQGLFPDTISSDLTIMTLKGPVYGLTVTMSKMMEVGLDLKSVIKMTTINSARALGIEDTSGSLKPGRQADVSILDLKPGSWELIDTENQRIKATELIVPVLTIKSGQLIEIELPGLPKPL
jgi:dihydroorotase